MGCSVSRENIESEILILQLRKMKIKDEREAMLKLYKDVTGEKLNRKKVPDYIDHKAMREIKIQKRKIKNEAKIKKESSNSTKSNSKKSKSSQ
jgi:hypothetical protein